MSTNMNTSPASSSASPRFRTWPITATHSIEAELKNMGLKISADEIDGTSSHKVDGNKDTIQHPLSDALVSVGTAGRGGTGSFISHNGLIITNWHVAYDAVRQASLASSDGTDYVKEGFVADERTDEIPGPNYEVWITKSCVDVSKQVLDVISSEQDDPLKRSNLVRDKRQEIAQVAQAKEEEEKASLAGSIRCDVQEMLPNESYVLFTYQRLRDVRIVYVPPKSLGGFGGDTDNFEWPRHTADFTLLRAYVGPDGDAAEYSPDNVPYTSNAFIRVQKDGVNDSDMVFLLGFPGRTMRYAPSSRLDYSDRVAVPNMVKDFSRKLQLIAKHEKDAAPSSDAVLKLGSSKKSLANELKRSKGKILMMRKLRLIAERTAEEKELCEKAKETQVCLDQLKEIYDEFEKDNAKSVALEACRGVYAGSTLMAAGHALYEFMYKEQAKADEKRETSYRRRNIPFLCKRLGKRLGDIYSPHETDLVQDAMDLLSKTSALKAEYEKMNVILGDDIGAMVDGSKLRDLDADLLEKIFSKKEEETSDDEKSLKEDPFVSCAAILWDAYESDRDRTKALISERDSLFAELLECQRKFSKEVFYPDCNGSLRISAGHVEGYQGADAVWLEPSTTLAGLLDKATEAKLLNSDSSSSASSEDSEFSCPDRLYQMLVDADKTDNDADNILKVPVCVLYSTDTVGGNSGSPVMNAKGEFVAINFDRQRQGLMNEFKWSRDYSRSIGVDVRYILWLIGKYDGATHLIEEMLSDA